MIEQERVKLLNKRPVKRGSFILYWMQASQRAEGNHALEYAILKANKLNQPIITYFGIAERFPEANERHYGFMMEGLKETQESLAEKNIKMVVKQESPEVGVVEISQEASLVVVDRGYMKTERKWREEAGERLDCSFLQVESNVVVPVEEASNKEEYSAATFRPKIRTKLPQYLHPVSENRPSKSSLNIPIDSLDLQDTEEILSLMATNSDVQRVRTLKGGTLEAHRHLAKFLLHDLDDYKALKNDPARDCLSYMSPYLHFGQISPLQIALRIHETRSPSKEAYLEELIVRRELSMNYVFYSPNYDSYTGLPRWAQATLEDHIRDAREYLYNLKDLENGETHDRYWNAAQREMRLRGKMHGYMRMYWGKKILEWFETPQIAFKVATYLNNKWELDGRDPNGFAGVAWCFGKHDRPWKERSVFGKIRYMNARGLERKFDLDDYMKRNMG